MISGELQTFAGEQQPVTPELTPISLDARLRELEATLIAWALDAANGNKSQAARLLQVKRSTLGDRIARCGLDRPPAPDVDADAGYCSEGRPPLPSSDVSMLTMK